MSVADNLRKLRDQATPGEWQELEPTVCTAHGGHEIAYLGENETEHAEDDAKFIAAAGNLWPLLCDLVQAVEGGDPTERAEALMALAAASKGQL